jgi:hypothetical protein
VSTRFGGEGRASLGRERTEEPHGQRDGRGRCTIGADRGQRGEPRHAPAGSRAASSVRELAVDDPEVVLDGLLGDRERASGLPVRVPASHPSGHRELTRSQQQALLRSTRGRRPSYGGQLEVAGGDERLGGEVAEAIARPFEQHTGPTPLILTAQRPAVREVELRNLVAHPIGRTAAGRACRPVEGFASGISLVPRGAPHSPGEPDDQVPRPVVSTSTASPHT